MKKFIKLFIVSILACACISPVTVFAEEKSQAKSAYLYDFNTKTAIYARNENARLPIASMTKIMLLDLIYENVENGALSLEESVVISEKASGMGGSQVFLEANGSYLVKDLVKSITVASANDASVAIAERLYGSEEECVKKMNEKVKVLGLTNTLFANCTGLPKPMQYSCAKDITLIFADLISHEQYFEFSGVWLDEIKHSKNSTQITNTNKLIKFYNGCDGGKTGFTNEAGFCLTATAKRGNMRLISAVIGASDSKSRFSEVSNMLNLGFNGYENKAVLDKSVPLDSTVSVLGGKVKQIEVLPENNFFVLSKKGEKIDCEVEYVFSEVRAPIKRGNVVGEAIIYVSGVEKGRVRLVSACDSGKMGFIDYVKEIAGKWAV
ncbi:MAG: D-alanyl-D-alanine carboxypeptidase [Clostridia bacterium]|nr:D-alanyl-D-alanine carboxypeptidase [Clostridia bacterium]